MKLFGLYGGGTLYELGPMVDIRAFFRCVQKYSANPGPHGGYGLIADRLYRRYVGLKDLDEACEQMKRIKDSFHTIKTSDTDLADLGVSADETRLDFSKETLAEVFAKYFTGFESCATATKSFYEDWKKELPIRVVHSDIVGFTEDKVRPLSQYEALQGEPLWLRA
jgi:hypothetical protein